MEASFSPLSLFPSPPQCLPLFLCIPPSVSITLSLPLCASVWGSLSAAQVAVAAAGTGAFFRTWRVTVRMVTSSSAADGWMPTTLSICFFVMPNFTGMAKPCNARQSQCCSALLLNTNQPSARRYSDLAPEGKRQQEVQIHTHTHTHTQKERCTHTRLHTEGKQER